MTKEGGLCISLFNGRLRFNGDGSSCLAFSYRIELANGYVPFPLLISDSTENRAKIAILHTRFPCLSQAVPFVLRLLWTPTCYIAFMVTLTNLY